ncbi:MAG TPA: peptide chain release factor N(5)-glutamine methyltransferase, partial [Limnochordia bacterium]
MAAAAPPAAPRTVLEVLRLAQSYLGARGVPAPRTDAEVLLAHVLGSSRIGLYVDHDKPLQPAELARYREAIRRRAAREPVAYIVGHKEFMSLDFIVDRRVLIPRPETERLVELVRDELVRRFPAASP